MALHESAEMYLETIYVLTKEKNTVRSIDIAESLNYSKPSVSRAVSNLKSGGYLKSDKDGFLTLTEAGRQVAEKIYARHTLITDFLLHLGVDVEIAEEDACKIEHAISDESFFALKRFVKTLKTETEPT